jgi:hypothetical protein
MNKSHEKRTYVYQSKLDGKIYGTTQSWSPQQAGRINAQNRKDGALGVWMDASYLTPEEINNYGSEEDAAKHFSSSQLKG